MQQAVLKFLAVVLGLYIYREHTRANILAGLEMARHIVIFTLNYLSSGTSIDTLHSPEQTGTVVSGRVESVVISSG